MAVVVVVVVDGVVVVVVVLGEADDWGAADAFDPPERGAEECTAPVVEDAAGSAPTKGMPAVPVPA